MRPVGEEVRERIRVLCREGVGRNEIARQVDVSVATVTKVVQEAEGLSFDRSATADAVAARRLDLQERRGKIIDRLYGRAEHVLARLEAETFRYWVPVAGVGVEPVDDVDPPARDEKDLASSIASYLSQAVKLEAVDSGASAESGRDLLSSLFAGLGRVAAAMDEPAPDTEGDESEDESPAGNPVS